MAATLNKSETKKVKDAQKLLDLILHNGYDPKLAQLDGGSVEQIRLRLRIREAKEDLREVVLHKGHRFS